MGMNQDLLSVYLVMARRLLLELIIMMVMEITQDTLEFIDGMEVHGCKEVQI